MKVLKVCS